jgi:chaperone BCS1
VVTRHVVTDAKQSRHPARDTGARQHVEAVTCDNDDSPGSSPVDLQGAQFAAIQSLRTGNQAKDMMVAMLIPMAFKAFTDATGQAGNIADKIMKYFQKSPEASFTREIQVEQIRNAWGYSFNSNDESRNTVLVRALTLYLARQELNYKNASVNLMSVKEGRYYYDSDDGNSDDDEDKDSRSEAGQLKKNYRLARTAPEEQWTQVEPGVMFMKKTEDGDGGGEKDSKSTKRTVTITLSGSTEKKVDDFIDKAYSWYLDELRSMQDHSRYMYELVSVGAKKDGDDDGGDTAARKYRRYKLSDEKTFKSLFFHEKEMLLQLLEDFQGKKGKYAIPGYPHKLGILCHGPPGTGKTSMIKAMANHLQRNIVNVPLARIQTNSELMDVMFDSRYQVLGQEVPIKLRFKDIIFVMEDVDAISKIVHKRDSKDGSAASGLVVPPKAEDAAGGLESVKEETSEKASGDTPKEEDKEKPKEDKEEEACAGVDDEDGEKKGDPLTALASLLAPVGPSKDGSTSAYVPSSTSDKLNLSGILNALDGVVDSPNRILIMTTNHPEKLDPALIRPGRIDKKFLLSYMSGMCSSQMVSHYFQMQLLEADIARICELVDGSASRPGLQITPARLEQLCAEHETVESLCEGLQTLSGVGPSGQRLLRPKLSRQGSVSAETRLNVLSLERAQSEPLAPMTEAKRW